MLVLFLIWAMFQRPNQPLPGWLDLVLVKGLPAVTIVLLVWVYFGTYYLLTDRRLVIRSGPFCAMNFSRAWRVVELLHVAAPSG